MRTPHVTAALSATMIVAVLAMPPLAPATAQTNPQPNAQALVELPLIANWTGAPSHATAIAISPDGRVLVSGHRGLAMLWDSQTSRVLATLKGHEDYVAGAAFLGGRQVATADRNKGIAVWDIASGSKVASWSAPGAQILRLAAAPDGQRFATSSDDDKAVRLWDPSGKLVWERTGLTSWVGGLAYAQDGKVIAPDRAVRSAS